MEMLIDYDKLEEDLYSEDDPNKKTWWNEAVWRTLGLLIFIFVIQYGVTTIHFLSGKWTWDYNTFLLLLLGSVPSLIVIGLKVEMGKKNYIQKQKILRDKNDKLKILTDTINEKDRRIEKLTVSLQEKKREVNDLCATLEANSRAIEDGRT